MQTAGRSAAAMARRGRGRATKADRVGALVMLAISLGALAALAGKRSLAVLVLGAVVLLPALLIGRRRLPSPARWRAGAAGERATARVLRPLERRGWVCLDDLAVPGSRANVDHLLIGPGGLVVLDSKRWSHPWDGDDRHGWHYGGRPVRAAVATTVWELSRIVEVLGDAVGPAPATAMWVVHGPLPHPELVIDGVRIVGPERIVEAVSSLRSVLGPDRVQRLARVARGQLRPA